MGKVSLLLVPTFAWAANMSHAPSLLPGARNMHRNPRVGLSKRTSKPAKSTLRRAALMGTLPATQKAAVHHLLPTVRSIDRRTAEEKASVFDWVSARVSPLTAR